jgi:hypothetical protein
MTSTWPMMISLGSSIPFAAWSASTVVPNCSAIAASVSPSWTTYVRCVGAGVATGVGRGVGVGAGVGTAVGEDVGVADALGVGRGEAVGVGVDEAGPDENGTALAAGEASATPGTMTPDATAMPAAPRTRAAPAPSTTGPRGARLARPAMPRHAGVGASVIRVDTRPSPMSMLPGTPPFDAATNRR